MTTLHDASQGYDPYYDIFELFDEWLQLRSEKLLPLLLKDQWIQLLACRILLRESRL